MLVDLLAKTFASSWKLDSSLEAEVAVNAGSRVVLMKPQTFMNDVGRSVRGLVKYGGQYDALYIVYDDLDLPVGSYKIEFDHGPKIHNGVNSVREAMGDALFWHVRLGTDGRNGDRSVPGDEYVLQPFSAEEKSVFEAILVKVAEELHAKIVSS
jgi:PTH1 family peptidyl-tRNA hydrolase